MTSINQTIGINNNMIQQYTPHFDEVIQASMLPVSTQNRTITIFSTFIKILLDFPNSFGPSPTVIASQSLLHIENFATTTCDETTLSSQHVRENVRVF
jgi:hypothetical protein